MSQSEKSDLDSILSRVMSNVQEQLSKRSSPPPPSKEEDTPVEVDPSVLAVRECIADIKSGKFDPRKHALWEMNLIN